MPVVVNDVFKVYNTANTANLHVLDNDFDVEGALVLVGATTPEHGQLAQQGNVLIYTPALNYNGPDHFVYTVRDSDGMLGNANVDLDVEVLNLPAVDLGIQLDKPYLNSPFFVFNIGGNVELDLQACYIEVDGEKQPATITQKTISWDGSSKIVEGQKYRMRIYIEAKGKERYLDPKDGIKDMSFDFYVDATAPVVSFSGLPTGGIFATNQMSIGGGFSDGLSGIDHSGLKLYIDGVEKTDVTSAWQWTGSLLDGIHVVTVMIKDFAGNYGSKSEVVKVDTKGPVVEIFSPREGEEITSSSKLFLNMLLRNF